MTGRQLKIVFVLSAVILSAVVGLAAFSITHTSGSSSNTPSATAGPSATTACGSCWIGTEMFSSSSSPSAHANKKTPLTASAIAAKYHCKQFRDTGPDMAGLSKDTGDCWIGNVKYGINIFKTQSARNTWLQLSEPFGVSPVHETSLTVFYVATSQSRNG